MQRFIKSLAQVLGYTINSAFMFVDDCWFTELICADFSISAYHILGKRLKELVARHFRTTVNDRLDEKLLISRQRLLTCMLLENDKV